MAKLLTDFAHTPMLHVGHQLYKEDANHYIIQVSDLARAG